MSWTDEYMSGRRTTTRRAVLRGGVWGTAGLVGAALIGCGDDDDEAAPAAAATQAPAATQAAAAAAATAAADEVKLGGVVKYNLGRGEPPNFDLHQNATTTVANSAGLGYSNIFQFDPFELDSVVPDLAASYEFPDDLTLILHLNEASFHDGQAFGSADVAATLDRIGNPPEGVASPRKGQLGAIDSVDTVDDRTAKINLSRPSAALIPTLAVNWMAVYSAKDIADGFDHKLNINGTGPFILDRYDRGNKLVFSKNPNYFLEGKPYIDGIEEFIIPDRVRAFAALRAGDLDISSVGRADKEILEREEVGKIVVSSAASVVWYLLVINVNRPPWNDSRSWKAASLAIDRNVGVQTTLDGGGFIGGLFSPGSFWTMPDSVLETIPGFSGPMEPRRAEARKLLDAAGIPEGTEVQMMTRDSYENHAVQMIGQLKQIGLEPKLDLQESATYYSRIDKRQYGDMAPTLRSAGFMDPDVIFGDNYITGAGRAWSGIEDATFDAMAKQVSQALDREERKELTDKAQEYYLNLFPPEMPYWGESRNALTVRVKGYGELYGSSYVSRRYQWLWLDS